MISYILISLFFICKAISDKLAHHYGNSIFRNLNPTFWNPLESWKNKWKVNPDGSLFLKNGKKVEKYLGSSTIFVKFTDAWHLFNSIGINCVVLAVIVYPYSRIIISTGTTQYLFEFVFYLSGLIWFNLFYDKILVNK